MHIILDILLRLDLYSPQALDTLLLRRWGMVMTCMLSSWVDFGHAKGKKVDWEDLESVFETIAIIGGDFREQRILLACRGVCRGLESTKSALDC
jgi:hypothetical protein